MVLAPNRVEQIEELLSRNVSSAIGSQLYQQWGRVVLWHIGISGHKVRCSLWYVGIGCAQGLPEEPHFGNLLVWRRLFLYLACKEEIGFVVARRPHGNVAVGIHIVRCRYGGAGKLHRTRYRGTGHRVVTGRRKERLQ